MTDVTPPTTDNEPVCVCGKDQMHPIHNERREHVYHPYPAERASGGLHSLADCRRAVEDHIGQRASGGLDVERLARALISAYGHYSFEALPNVARVRAEDIAAEYARLATPQPGEPLAGHGAVGKHYPRTGDAIRGFLGGATATVCDACGVPMTLNNGKWLATPQPGEPTTRRNPFVGGEQVDGLSSGKPPED